MGLNSKPLLNWGQSCGPPLMNVQSVLPFFTVSWRVIWMDQLNSTGRKCQPKTSQNLEEWDTMDRHWCSQGRMLLTRLFNKTHVFFPHCLIGMIIWSGMAKPSQNGLQRDNASPWAKFILKTGVKCSWLSDRLQHLSNVCSLDGIEKTSGMSSESLCSSFFQNS